MKILALDQASEKTGIAYFENSDLKDYGLINMSKVHGDQRMSAMVLEIYKIIDEVAPEVVVLEDVAFQKNAASLILLARIQGAIIGYCLNKDIKTVIYKSSSWRKMLGFDQGKNVKRPALKKQAFDFVKEHYGLRVAEDEADAICIGCAWAVANGYIEYKEEETDETV